MKAMEATTDTPASNVSRRHNAGRSNAKQIASTIASARRTCDTHPNCVKVSTSRSAPEAIVARRLSPLNDIANNSTQVSPETTAKVIPIHAVARSCLSTHAFARGSARKARSATSSRKITAPAVIAEAVK